MSDKRDYDKLSDYPPGLLPAVLSFAIRLVIFAIRLVSVRNQALFDTHLVSRTLSTPWPPCDLRVGCSLSPEPCGATLVLTKSHGLDEGVAMVCAHETTRTTISARPSKPTPVATTKGGRPLSRGRPPSLQLAGPHLPKEHVCC